MTAKQEYQEELELQLNEWQKEIDLLKIKASAAPVNLEKEINNHIEKLQGKIDEGKASLAELTEADENTWEIIKEGSEALWKLIKLNVEEAVYKIQKKI